VIFNRSLDPAAPLMHEFTYEAQVYDLLYRDEHGIVHLTPPPAPTPVPVVQDAKSVAADRKAPVVEKKAEKDEKKKTDDDAEIVLTETDELWVRSRFLHIGEAGPSIANELKALEANPAYQFMKQKAEGKQVDSKQLGKVAQSIGTMRAQKAVIEKHMKLVTTLNKQNVREGKKDFLRNLAEFEQTLVLGKDDQDEKMTAKKIKDQLIPWLQEHNYKITPVEKLRLFLLFVSIFEKPSESGMEVMIGGDPATGACAVGPELRRAIENLGKFCDTTGKKDGVFRAPNTDPDDNKMQLRRFLPELAGLLQNVAKNNLDEKVCPFVGSERPQSSQSLVPATGGRRGRDKKEESAKPACFVFCLGGVTLSEIRELHKVNNKQGANLVLGSDCILTPLSYIRQLTNIKFGPREGAGFYQVAKIPYAPTKYDLHHEKELESDDDEELEDLPTVDLTVDDGADQQSRCCGLF